MGVSVPEDEPGIAEALAIDVLEGDAPDSEPDGLTAAVLDPLPPMAQLAVLW